MHKKPGNNMMLDSPPSWLRISMWLLLYAAVWFVLTGSDYGSWILGVPVVILATALNLSLANSSGCSFSFLGVLRFVVFFLRQSFLSGFDVMRRAFSPRLKINPGLIPYTTFLPEGTARILFINTISLLPGTLSADLRDNVITVHTIDKDLPVWGNLQNLEAIIAVIFYKKNKKTAA